MKFIENNNAIHIKKMNETQVAYYILNNYEIHYNVIPANTKQEWHSHKYINEILFVIEGQIEVLWEETGDIHVKKLKKHDLADMENSIHTVINSEEMDAQFLIIKINFDTENPRLIKEDKVLFPDIMI